MLRHYQHLGMCHLHYLFSNDEENWQILENAGLITVLKKHLSKLESLIALKSPFDLLILNEPGLAIPETGVAGSTPKETLMYLYLDSEFLDVNQMINVHLPAVLAHEFHHLSRWRSLGYGETLFEELITEGMAVFFEEEYGGFQPLHSKALTKRELDKVWKMIQPFLHQKEFDHFAWFFGNDEVPRWSGYQLGYLLVKKYLALHPSVTVLNLADKHASTFLSESI